MMSAKKATPGLLKIKLFWNKGCDVIIYVHDLTNQLLSRDSNCIVDIVMWPNFGNSSICVREVFITSMLYGFHQKKHFCWGVVLAEVQLFGTCTRYGLEILNQCERKVKTKSQKFLVTNYYVLSYRAKTGRGSFLSPLLPSPSWIGLIIPHTLL